MKFMLPFNGDLELVEYFKDNPSVIGFYGSAPDISSSARESFQLRSDGEGLKKAIEILHNSGKIFKYVYNSLVTDTMQETVEVLRRLNYLSVDRVTVATPFHCLMASKVFDGEVEVSTIAEVRTPQMAEDWYSLSADKVTLSTALTRFPHLIRKYRNPTVIAQEICGLNCILRTSHYIDQSLSKKQEMKNYPYIYCQSFLKQNYPERLLRANWVPPSFLKHYPDDVEVKIVGRTYPTEYLIRVAEAYMSGTDPVDYLDILPYGERQMTTRDGERLRLLSKHLPTEFWEHFRHSKFPCFARDCVECGHCRNFARLYNDRLGERWKEQR